ncbi:MAG TPA: efflux RND transporter periplasmic adaptor subunit [Candidatus Saccharimonadales bacterium]|nr:efflux RND transporter periplasmic adaptor subunit [Candidatus Saccharimonadales bacterium]
MRRSLIRILLVLVIAVVAVWAVYERLRPRPVEVLVQPVERGWVESTVANTRAGTVKACRRAKLAPQISGQVLHLPVKKGDAVRKGDLLLELWNEDLRSNLALAKSDARAAGAHADQLCLAADLAEREADRTSRLFDNHVVDEQTRDRASSDEETTRAACVSARASAEESKSRVAVAQADLDKTILRAPFDGVVAELNAELGEVVAPSPPGIPTPPAVDLIENGCLYVTAPIDEIDGRRVREGLTAKITLDAFPNQHFDGTVRRVAPYVLDREKQSRTLEVEVAIDHPESLPNLLPGYSADVEILLERKDGVLRIPAEAISGEGRVLVLKDGVLQERRIEEGLANWQYVEITSGLEEGEKVVLSLDRAGVEAGASAVAEKASGS